MKCTEIYNTRAQSSLCLLNVLIADVFIAVAVVVCLQPISVQCIAGFHLSCDQT